VKVSDKLVIASVPIAAAGFLTVSATVWPDVFMWVAVAFMLIAGVLSFASLGASLAERRAKRLRESSHPEEGQ
jgi:hypothetical protein